MARNPLMVGNWKMNNTIAEATVLAQEICNRFEKDWAQSVDVAVCPPYVDIKPAKTVFEFDRVPVAVGAQNVFWAPSGAYTGEISIPMLEEIGCRYCIIGHSERREIFGETNEMVNRKLKALVATKIAPIVCVGESLGIREAGTTDEYIEAQVRAAFAGVGAADAAKCVVAYEPIWAIGTGRTATPEAAQAVCALIRGIIADLYGESVANGMRILYGGSMKPENVAGLIAQPDIDGGLVGGASLKAVPFLDLVKACL